MKNILLHQITLSLKFFIFIGYQLNLIPASYFSTIPIYPFGTFYKLKTRKFAEIVCEIPVSRTSVENFRHMSHLCLHSQSQSTFRICILYLVAPPLGVLSVHPPSFHTLFILPPMSLLRLRIQFNFYFIFADNLQPLTSKGEKQKPNIYKTGKKHFFSAFYLTTFGPDACCTLLLLLLFI